MTAKQNTNKSVCRFVVLIYTYDNHRNR